VPEEAPLSLYLVTDCLWVFSDFRVSSSLALLLVFALFSLAVSSPPEVVRVPLLDMVVFSSLSPSLLEFFKLFEEEVLPE